MNQDQFETSEEEDYWEPLWKDWIENGGERPTVFVGDQMGNQNQSQTQPDGEEYWLKLRNTRATQIAAAVKKSNVRAFERVDYLHRLVTMNQSFEKPPPFKDDGMVSRYPLVRSFTSTEDLENLRQVVLQQMADLPQCFHVAPLCELALLDLIRHWDLFELDNKNLVAIELVFESCPLILLQRPNSAAKYPDMLRLDLSQIPAFLSS